MVHIRKLAFCLSVAASVAVFVSIFVLTEQGPAQTTALSTSVGNALASQPAAGVAITTSPNAPDQSLAAAAPAPTGPVSVLLSIAGVRKWAHSVEFLAFGTAVSLASVLWWGRPHRMPLRALLALAICVLASLFDQTHKLFVPGREFDAGDLLFDLLGYSIAILVCFACERLLWILSNRRRLGSAAIGS